MRLAIRHAPEWLRATGVGLAAVAGSIIVPSVAITAFAVVSRSADQIGQLALRIAEPLGMAGAMAAVLLFPARQGPHAGVIRGAAAALAIYVAAAWTGDIDWWTRASVVALPMLGAVASLARASVPAGAPREDSPSVQALAPGEPEILRTTSRELEDATHISN
jgi:hypothetical protein